MAGLEILGIALVVIAIVYSFFKKKDKVGLALIIVLLVLLFMLSQLGRLKIF